MTGGSAYTEWLIRFVEDDYVCTNVSVPIETLVTDVDERGREYARELVTRYGDLAPTGFAARCDVNVETDEWEGTAGFRLLGTYGDHTITVYDATIRQVAQESPLPSETVRELVVAHELGHHVIPSDDRAVRFRVPIPVVRNVPWIGRKVSLERTSPGLLELASHAFASELVDVAPLSHSIQLLADGSSGAGGLIPNGEGTDSTANVPVHSIS